jgi:hypothetical protein
MAAFARPELLEPMAFQQANELGPGHSRTWSNQTFGFVKFGEGELNPDLLF